MRTIIAALLATIVFYIWQTLTYTVLPIGNWGFQAPANEDAVLATVEQALPNNGIYMLPYIDPSTWNDPEKNQAWIEKSKANSMWMIIRSEGHRDPGDMSQQFAWQIAAVFVGALLAAVVASFSQGFTQRVVVVLMMGLFGWIVQVFPLWNWYRIPPDFIHARLFEHFVGWSLAGLVIAWWLGRKRLSA